MSYIKFADHDKMLEASVRRNAENLVTLKGVDVNTSGFKMYKDEKGKLLLGDYSDFKTLYKKETGYFTLSNDGTVWTEPEVTFDDELEEIIETEKGATVGEKLDTLEKELLDTQLALTEIYEMMEGE